MWELERICSSLEHSLRFKCRQLYMAHTGKKEPLGETDDSRNVDEELYTIPHVKIVQEALDAAIDEEEKRKLLYIYRSLLFQTMDYMVRDDTNAIKKQKEAAEIAWGGKRISFLQGKSLLLTETDPDKRKELYHRLESAEARWNPLREKCFLHLQEQARQWGYPHYLAFYSESIGIDLLAWGEKMRNFLTQTDDLYKKVFSIFVSKPGQYADRYELYPLLAGGKYNPYFREIELLPTLEDTLYGLGINILQQSSIILDVEKRLNKSACCCSPMLIPKEIYLVVFPKGGLVQYELILMEAGRAEYYAHIGENLPWMYKLLGDSALPYTYAHLLQDLLSNRKWIGHHLPMDEKTGEEFYRFSLFRKLFRWRQHAAMFLYELSLYASHVTDGLSAHYASLLREATGTAYREETFLANVEKPFASLHLMRSWMFADQLRASLQQKYKDVWFQDLRAGQDLKEMWAYGAQYTLEEWCERLGFQLNTDPFVQEIQKVWG